MRPILLFIALIYFAPMAGAAVLYDGSLSGTPDVQGWNYLAGDASSIFDPIEATQIESGGVTTLDSDDTRSARAAVELTYIEVLEKASAVPEPRMSLN